MVNQVVLVVLILIIFIVLGGIGYYLYTIRGSLTVSPVERKFLEQRDFWIAKAIEEGEGRGKWYFSPQTGYLCSQHEQRGVYDTLEECMKEAEKSKPIVQLGDSCNASVRCAKDFKCHDQICKKEVKKGADCADRLVKCVGGTICGENGICIDP